MEVLDKPVSIVAAYTPFYAQLATLEKENSELAFSYDDPRGNKEARSHVYKLRQAKGALERTRKEAKAESLRIGRAVDAEAEQIEARIEAMIAVHQVKLDEIEQREKDRIAGLKEKIAVISEIHFGKTVEEYGVCLRMLEAIKIDDKWQEFIGEAAQAKDASIAKHRELLAERERQDAEAAELAKLRAEAEERAQKERDEAIAKAAAERAAKEAAILAEQEAAKARKAIEDAEAKAAQEREAAARRELELKLQAEKAERRRVEAEQKAEQDRKDAIIKAEAEKQAAIQAEIDRAVAQKRVEEAEKAKREADTAHRKKINNAALKGFVDGGIDEECAKDCIKLIATGKVPNVQINY